MSIKLFSFNVDTEDPRTIKLEASGSAYILKNRELVPVPTTKREFNEEQDIFDFDAEFGDLFNISFNDLIHGEYIIEVYEGDVQASSPILKVYAYKDRVKGKSGVLFKIIGEDGALIYTDNMYFSPPLQDRIGRIARALGVDRKHVESIVQKYMQAI